MKRTEVQLLPDPPGPTEDVDLDLNLLACEAHHAPKGKIFLIHGDSNLVSLHTCALTETRRRKYPETNVLTREVHPSEECSYFFVFTRALLIT